MQVGMVSQEVMVTMEHQDMLGIQGIRVTLVPQEARD